MKPWYKITAKANKAKILIYEQIGEDFFGEGVSAKKFVNELDGLNVSSIDLHINSPGGSVFDGTSIYNALVSHDAVVNVTVDGIAASIASVIAMAGDTIEMPENSLLMIHDPSALVMGTAKDMEKMAETLGKIKGGMIKAYQTKIAMDDDEISEMMSNETWLTANEAAELGIIDKTSEPVEISAQFQALTNFKNVPKGLKKAWVFKGQKFTPSGETILQEDEVMNITLELIQAEHPEIVAEILKTVNIDYVRENLPEAVTAFESEGAEAERKRIEAVRDQSMPGHDALIEEMMFDGSTTGEQAAVKILQAEKKNREIMAADIVKDAPDTIEQPSTDNVDEVILDNLPVDKRCEARWKKDQDLQNEFGGDFDAYLAYEKALDAGRVKVLGA